MFNEIQSYCALPPTKKQIDDENRLDAGFLGLEIQFFAEMIYNLTAEEQQLVLQFQKGISGLLETNQMKQVAVKMSHLQQKLQREKNSLDAHYECLADFAYLNQA